MGMCDAPQGWRPEGNMTGTPQGWQYGNSRGGSMIDPPPGWQPKQPHPNYNNYGGGKRSTFIGRLFFKLFVFILIFAGYMAVQIYSQPGKDFNAKLNNWYIKLEKNQPKDKPTK